MSCFGLIRWRKERGDDVDDTEKGLEEAFFRRLTNEKVVYLWNDVYVYGDPFIKKMEDYSKTIDICAREFFPSIESIALPTEVSIDIARKTHLMQTMPNVLLYPMSAEDNLSPVKDVISEKASEEIISLGDSHLKAASLNIPPAFLFMRCYKTQGLKEGKRFL